MKTIIPLLKLNIFILGVLLIVLPSVFIFNLNKGFENLQPKKFLAVKTEGNPEIIKLNPSNKPLINDDSVRYFVKEAVINIYNYNSTNYNNRNRYASYFTKNGLQRFENGFIENTEFSIGEGVQIFKTVIMEEPLLIKKMKGVNIWQFYVKVLTQYKSELRSVSVPRNIILYVKEEKIEESKKGIAIDDIRIR